MIQRLGQYDIMLETLLAWSVVHACLLQVPDRTCSTAQHRECVTEFRPVTETAFVDECHDIETQVVIIMFKGKDLLILCTQPEGQPEGA